MGDDPLLERGGIGPAKGLFRLRPLLGSTWPSTSAAPPVPRITTAALSPPQAIKPLDRRLLSSLFIPFVFRPEGKYNPPSRLFQRQPTVAPFFFQILRLHLVVHRLTPIPKHRRLLPPLRHLLILQLLLPELLVDPVLDLVEAPRRPCSRKFLPVTAAA